MTVDAKAIADRIEKIITRCKVDVRKPFRCNDLVEYARISDLKQPFEKQPKLTDDMMHLYDGFVLQGIFARMLQAKEMDHVHVIITDLLTCTFSEEDWRYHARAVVCGTPSIISTKGIVEAPAKPREFYLAQFGGSADLVKLKRDFQGRFIDHGDPRMTEAAAVYALQALFFFVADGEPFCEDTSCLLYNAHYQEELIALIEKGTFCAIHRRMANKFNKKTGLS